MAATEATYAVGTLDLPCLVLDQGATIRRQIANLGSDWTKIGIAFATRIIGTASLASSAANENFAATAAATRVAIGLKNNNGALVGQSGCKFLGMLTGPLNPDNFGWTRSAIVSGAVRSHEGANNIKAGVVSGLSEVITSATGLTEFSSDPSGGTEETTNFANIQALVIEVVNRGESGQQLIFRKNASTTVSVVTQANLESAILSTVSASAYTVDCPHATYDLSDIDCVFIQWPFANNRLLVFGPTSGFAGSPYFMRLT